jgi:DNA polymerase delta subunit 4
MPPKRRVSGPATKSSQQSTLAFHGASNKVTKAGTRPQGAKKNVLADVAAKKDAKPEVVKLIEEPTTAGAALIDQTKEEVVEAQEAQSTPEEDEARQISDAAIKKYWAAKEKQRMAPRVHQEDLSLHEKVLREFDMSSHYGVCLPVTGNRYCYNRSCAVVMLHMLTSFAFCSPALVSPD